MLCAFSDDKAMSRGSLPEGLLEAISVVQGVAVAVDGFDSDAVFPVAKEIQRAYEEQAKIDAEKPENWSPGRRIDYSTIFAGISPDTKKPMYLSPSYLGGLMDLEEAHRYAAEYTKSTREKYRLPSVRELKVLFNNRAALGGFVTEGSHEGWYWAGDNRAWGAAPAVCLMDGRVAKLNVWTNLKVRLIRD